MKTLLEFLVKGKLNNVSNQVMQFTKDMPKFKLFSSKNSKENITNEIISKAKFVLYDINSLGEFFAKHNENAKYIVCWWKDLGPNTFTYYKASSELYNIKWESDYAFELYNDSTIDTIQSIDIQNDYKDDIKEIIIFEI